jgi:hypothetical protein
MTAPTNPISEGIKAHRRASRRFKHAAEMEDLVTAEQEGRKVTKKNEAEYQAALKAEDEALEQLMSTTPATPAEAHALLSYTLELMDRGDYLLEVMSDLLNSLLNSPLLSPSPAKGAPGAEART